MGDPETAASAAPASQDPGTDDTMEARLAALTRSPDDPELSDARQRVRALLFGDPTPARPPRTVGRFVLEGRLGAGGMGEVFAAHDPELGRRVALKLVHRDRSDSPAARARLLREAQAMARLSHPNVVTVYESGVHEDRVYVAMELVAGVELRALFRGEPPWRRVVEVYCEAARGLAAAHAVGLVHRDFKPENVMIGDDGRVRVLDFGLARESDETPAADAPVSATLDDTSAASGDTEGRSPDDLLGRSMTRSGVLIGSPAYMAPEQFLTGEATPRSDQYSFCVALYESLYGQRPFAGVSLVALLEARQANQVQPPPPEREVPRAVHAAVMRGLQADPAARFPSMDALLAALQRCLARRRRLQLGLGLGGLTALALALGYFVAGRPEPFDPCAGGDEAIAAVWSPERAAALKAEFARSGAPEAAEIGARVAARVDAYTAAWTAGHADACAAATITGAQAQRLAELRMACLSDARRELAETLEVLAGAEPAVVLQSVQTVAGLPELRRCGDSEALLARVPPPADPAQRAAVEAMRTRIGEVRALRRAGLAGRAAHEAEGLARAAVDLGHPPLSAELDLLRGELWFDAARFDAAKASLERGFWAAIDCSHDEVAARAAIALANLVGGRQAALEPGLGWARQAEAMIRRGHLSPRLLVALRRSEARMLRVAGQFDRARAQLEAALEIQRATPGADDLEAAQLLRDLGGTALDQGRPDAAAAAIEQALTHQRAALGERHPEVGRSLRLLGTTLYTAGRREEALQSFAAALEIAEAAYGAEHPDVADALNNMGATLDELGRDEEAVAAYERALAIRRARLGERHPDVAAVLDNLAIALTELGRLAEAEAAMRRAQEVLRAVHGERHPAIATNLLGQSSLSRTRGDHVRARELARAAAAMFAATLGPEHPDLAYALSGHAEIELAAGAPAAAVEPARQALALRTAADPQDPLLLAESRLRLGQALWLAGEDREAARELLRAARSGYAAHAPADALAGVDAWLAAQGLGP